ncbi:MAG: hypothetical protein MUF72_14300 [Elainella sp. Prado103]|jgi:hypothetical protein|nr:hypothetical protein [Elainella sp. Prado103]
MAYTFEILGVSPVLQFFNCQQEILVQKPQTGVAYLGSYKCTLDTLLESAETTANSQGWHLDAVVDTVVSFWMNNMESIRYWQDRLQHAGEQSLMISRLADLKSLRSEFEWLLRQ